MKIDENCVNDDRVIFATNGKHNALIHCPYMKSLTDFSPNDDVWEFNLYTLGNDKRWFGRLLHKAGGFDTTAEAMEAAEEASRTFA